MSRGSFEHMLQVASKKQALGDIVEDILQYTDDEIDQITTQPAWIRKHLKTLRAEKAAQVRMATMPTLPPPADTIHIPCPVREYTGHSSFNIKNGKGFGIDIEPGDVFMIINDWEIKLNSTVVKVNHEEGDYLIKMSKFVDTMTIYDYNAYLQNVLDRKYNGSSHDIDDRDTEYGYWNAVRIDK